MERFTNGSMIVVKINQGEPIEEMELQYPITTIDKTSNAVYEDTTIPNAELPVSYWVAGTETIALNTVFTGTPDEIKEIGLWFERLTKNTQIALILGELFEGQEFVVRSVKTSYERFISTEDLRPTLVRISLDLNKVFQEV